ncbi:MAG: ABC transporter ATP-binding protein, partial [Myxococcales bacterium]|nr:ABC transporter ATP-binding protein [Myxococcales bacterium]
YEVDDGQVFIDGIDLNRIPLKTLRGHIAMVPQESFLFSQTLADNVAFGLERTEAASVRAASERAQLAKDVDDLPAGYDTLVGERGVMLSGGQRQRTALARALAQGRRGEQEDRRNDCECDSDASNFERMHGPLRVWRLRDTRLKCASAVPIWAARGAGAAGSRSRWLQQASCRFRIARDDDRQSGL